LGRDGGSRQNVTGSIVALPPPSSLPLPFLNTTSQARLYMIDDGTGTWTACHRPTMSLPHSLPSPCLQGHACGEGISGVRPECMSASLAEP